MGSLKYGVGLLTCLFGLTWCATCPTGWREYNGYCYLFRTITSIISGKSWENARLSCQLYGGDLADIRDKSENDFILKSQSALERKQHFWLGISDRVIEGTFQYVDGTNVSYFNWNRGEPNNYGGNEDCVETIYDGTFNDNSCEREFGYICKKKKGAPTPTPRTVPPRPTGTTDTSCDAGWTGFNGLCYFLVWNVPSTFQEARQDCQDRGGDLAMPKTREQQAFLTRAATTSVRYDFWIGLTDSFQEGKFNWVDKTWLNDSLSNWAPNEPSNDFGGEDCVQMYSRYVPGKWNDNHCSAKLAYICEKPTGRSLCPDGWIALGDYCYQLNVHPEQKTTWSQARQACMSFQGGDLLSISSEEEEKMVVEAAKPTGTSTYYFWIGLNDNKTRGTFEWSDGAALTYTHWGYNQPRIGSPGRYFYCGQVLIGGQVAQGSSYWSTVSCYYRLYYVCKRRREYGRCHDPLGMEDFNIGNDKITASSQLSATTPPYAARWNHIADLGLDGAWCAALGDTNPYLQVDIGRVYKIKFLGLQGKANSAAFVRSFHLEYGDDGVRWSSYGYNPPQQYKQLPGNSNYNMRKGIVITLNPPITARYVKINPLSYQTNVCLRVELYGCETDVSSACGENWVDGYQDGLCYKFSRYQLTWAAARADCLSSGGDLLSITSNVEKLYIKNKLTNYKDQTDKFWIGLNDRDYSRIYKWSDGSPVKVINWFRSNPKDRNDRMDCVGILSDGGYWFDDDCYVKRKYICKKQAVSQAVAKTPFNSVWISATSHYWPLNEIVDGQILGTRIGSVYGAIKVDSAFMNRKHLNLNGKGTSLQIPEFKHSCVSVPQLCFYGVSVSFVINVAAASDSTRYILDIAGQNSSDAVGWSVSVQSTTLNVMVRGEHKTWVGTVAFPVGKWHHVVFTWSLSDNLRIYVDGKAVKSTDSYKANVPPNTNEAVSTLFVGGSATSATANLPMEVMSLAIWERKLSLTEVEQVYKSEMKKCGEGWIMYGQFCYTFETTRRNWIQADTYCQSEGGQLVSINSGVEQALVTIGVGSDGIAQNAWLGLNSKELDHIYNWTDGSPLSFTNWATGEPNNMFGYKREDCGETWQTGFWNDEYCSIRKAHICKKEKEVDPSISVSKGGFERQIVIPQYSVSPLACPLGTSILVNSAVYGKASSSCKKDVKNIVISSCSDQQKFYCLLKSSNDVFGDPCSTVIKELTVSYNCTPDNNFFESYTIGCPEGWSLRPGKESCYRLFFQEKTWRDARKFCQNAASGAELVSISSRTEQVFLTTLLVDAYVNPEVWNGLSDLVSPGQYAWSDNSSVTYTNWFNGQPDESSRQQSCVTMTLQQANGDVMYWIDDDCEHKHPFMCEVPKKAATRPPPVTTNKPNGTCSDGWTRVKNSCFKVVVKSLSWLDARDNCVKEGGKLASILDKGENEGVFNILLSGPQNQSIQEAWIGLTDKGIFRGQYWVDGLPVSFTLWDTMEPNSYLNMKACGIMASNGNWRDTECSFLRPSICKAQVRVQTTSPPTTTAKPTPSQDPNICSSGWQWWSGNGMCYFVKNTTVAVDWFTARSFCSMAGGELVSIHNKEEQTFVASLLPRFYSGRAWIGLNDLEEEGGFKWSDGSQPVFFNFEANQPDDWHGMEDCVEIRNVGYWNDASCSRTFPYICKRQNNTTPVATTLTPTAGPVSGYCDPGWLHYRNKCYKLYFGDDNRRTWKSARDFCRGINHGNRKGDLVSIHSSYENAFINSRIRDPSESLWIGFNDLQVENTFGWSDQSRVTYTNWNYRQPDNFGQEDCAEMASYYLSHGKWNDLSCDSLRGFICQVAASQTKPTGSLPTEQPKCPKDYMDYEGNCYSVKNTPASWDDAREVCRKDHARSELVSIHSPYEQDYVFSFFAEFVTSIWIGFHRLANVTKYQWSDNTPADYTFWQGGVGALPFDEKGCAYARLASYSYGRWEKSSCDKKLPFLCKLTKSEVDVKPNYPGTCPSEWIKKNKYCYLVQDAYFHRAEWVNARQNCRSLGGDLASIHSKDEQSFLHYRIRDSYRSLWIGLNDRAVENQFVWSDETPFDFTYWNEKEPNDKGGVENCVEINPLTGKWNDLKCSQYLGYICKKNLECSQALGMENKTIPDTAISASSVYDQHFAQFGRLNFKGTTRAWCTNITDTNQYLEIDVGMTTRVTRIAIQGLSDNAVKHYILSFRLFYSEDRVNWKPYQVNGRTMVLIRKGNSVQTDSTSIKDGQAGRYFRINPVTWKGPLICMMVELYGCRYVCEAPLGIESKVLKDRSFTASSASPSYQPSDGRLNLGGGHAWCAKTDNVDQWLQIDLAGIVQISKVATQGLSQDSDDSVVTAYKISYSDDGEKWTEYKAINGETRIFSGNTFASSAVFHRFSSAVSGRYIRFYPLSWKNHICMRVEVFGCPLACDQPLGMESGKIPKSDISASTVLDSDHLPDMGRLNVGGNGAGAWCAKTNDRRQYLQIDMKGEARVTAISVQGFDNSVAQFVTEYIVQYSVDGKFWNTYAVNDKIMVFQGSKNGYTPNKVELISPLHGRFIRLNPQQWETGICMRVELYGCILNSLPTEEPPTPKKVVQVEMRFTKVKWQMELLYRTSKEFKDLANRVKKTVEKLYLDDYAFREGFESVEVTGFRPGSVIVDFVVIFGTEDTKMTEPLKNAVKSGKMGDFEVDEDYLKIKVEGKPEKQTGKHEESSGLSRGGKIALIVFFLVLIATILVAGAFWYWKKRWQTNQFAPKSFDNPVHYDPATYNVDAGVSG